MLTMQQWSLYVGGLLQRYVGMHQLDVGWGSLQCRQVHMFLAFVSGILRQVCSYITEYSVP